MYVHTYYYYVSNNLRTNSAVSAVKCNAGWLALALWMNWGCSCSLDELRLRSWSVSSLRIAISSCYHSYGLVSQRSWMFTGRVHVIPSIIEGPECIRYWATLLRVSLPLFPHCFCTICLNWSTLRVCTFIIRFHSFQRPGWISSWPSCSQIDFYFLIFQCSQILSRIKSSDSGLPILSQYCFPIHLSTYNSFVFWQHC